MNEPLISYIVPVYNAKEYLRCCLDSICNQEPFEDKYEVIIVNDGSNDGSADICEEYALRYSDKVHLIHQENQGVSSARNRGLDAASGEYIWFVDADDWIESGALQYLKDIIQKSHGDVILFGGEKFQKSPDYSYYTESPNEFLKKHYTYWVSQMLFRREIIELNGIRFTLGMKMAEDLEFQYKYLSYVKTPVQIKYSLYNLRLREGSASRNALSHIENYKCSVLLLSNYYQFIKERPYSNFEWMSYRVEERMKSMLYSVLRNSEVNMRTVQQTFNLLYDNYSELGFKNLMNCSLRIARISVRLYCWMLLLNNILRCRK